MTHANNNKRRSLCFLPAVTLTVCALVLVCASMYWRFGRLTEEDRTTYRALLDEIHQDCVPTVTTTTHVRHGLQKDIYLNKYAGPEQFRLKSRDAKISLVTKAGRNHIAENLEGVCCWLQEELSYRFADGSSVSLHDPLWPFLSPVAIALHAEPRQRLLYLEADHATYHYKQEHFIAEDARIWRYELPGHQFDENVEKQNALFFGVADHVDISFGVQGIHFKAEGFKASLYQTGRKK